MKTSPANEERVLGRRLARGLSEREIQLVAGGNPSPEGKQYLDSESLITCVYSPDFQEEN